MNDSMAGDLHAELVKASQAIDELNAVDVCRPDLYWADVIDAANAMLKAAGAR